MIFFNFKYFILYLMYFYSIEFAITLVVNISFFQMPLNTTPSTNVILPIPFLILFFQ